jgi:hypothetical protein
LSREERQELDKRRYRQSIRPVEAPSRVLSTEERAEGELLRALLEPDWRSTVLKHVEPGELVTAAGVRLAQLVAHHASTLSSESNAVMRLVEAQQDDLFSAAIRDRAQEFRARMANVPITEELIVQCAQALKRARKQKRAEELAQELAQLLQKSPLSEVERTLIRNHTVEHQRLLKELKGSA